MDNAQNKQTPSTQEGKQVILSVKDLHISFFTDHGRVHAVRGVSFDLYKGETLCIVGESGSGKSVTSKTIMGILPGNARIDSGMVMYEGEDLTKISEDDFHRIRGHKIGMYFGNMVELATSEELFKHPLHPYTKALLSAIPKPDPLSEKNRVRRVYNPAKEHDYSKEKPSFREILPGHFVLCNTEEEKKYLQEIKDLDAANKK